MRGDHVQSIHAPARRVPATLTLAAAVATSPALAGDGDLPPGPPIFDVSAPSVSRSHDGPVRSVDLAFTVRCNEQAIAEGAEVQIIGRVLQQFGHGTIGGSNDAYVTCLPDTQSVVIQVTGSGLGFHPGTVLAIAGLNGCISATRVSGIGGREARALPAR